VAADAAQRLHGATHVKEASMATHVERIDVMTARDKAVGGNSLLVCAYEDDAKCRKGRLEGSIPLARLESMAASLPKSQEIIFYCA
jgi:hypothetical protein